MHEFTSYSFPPEDEKESGTERGGGTNQRETKVNKGLDLHPMLGGEALQGKEIQKHLRGGGVPVVPHGWNTDEKKRHRHTPQKKKRCNRDEKKRR